MNIQLRLLLCLVLYALCAYRYFSVDMLDMSITSNIFSALLISVLMILFFYSGKLAFYLSVDNNRKLNIFEIFFLPLLPIFLIGLPLSGFYFINPTIAICSIALIVILYDKDYKISQYFWEQRVKDFVKYPDSGIVEARIVEKKRLEYYGYCLLLPTGIYLLSKLHGY